MAKQQNDSIVARYYEDVMDLAGELCLANFKDHTFTLRLQNDSTVSGKFRTEHEATIRERLSDDSSREIRVTGRARFRSPGGMVESILHVDSIHAESAAEMNAQSERPLWEQLVEFGHSLPQDVKDALPEDLVQRFDHYLYGDE